MNERKKKKYMFRIKTKRMLCTIDVFVINELK